MKLSTAVIALVGSLVLVGCKPTPQGTTPETSPTLSATGTTSSAGGTSEIAGPDAGSVRSGAYIDYSESALASAQADGDAVLFFHAGWCPTCRATDKELLSRPGDIPEGLTIIKTDYDTEKELKAKYDIVTQHTFVHVDAQGNAISSWVGGGLDEILSNI